MAIAETVGVRAVVEGMSLFSRNALDFNRGIGGMITSAISTGAGIVLNPLKAFGGMLLNIFEIAVGFIARDVFNFIARGVADIARQAITAAGDFQILEIQLEGLIAQQLRQASGTRSMVAAGQEQVELTDKQRAQLEKLTRQYGLLGPQIDVAREKLAKDIEEGKLSQAEITLRQVKLSDMERTYVSVGQQIETLQSQDGALVTVMREVVTGQISMNEAMEQAGPAARDLIDWIADLAARSTLTVKGMTDMVRGFLTLDGVGVESAKRLTTAVSTWGAQMGLTEAQLGRIVDNILQTGRSSKITERDIREFGNAGLNLNLIFRQMGETLGISAEEALEFSKSGKEGVAAFVEAVQVVAEQEFPDAMKRIGSTWNVAMSNIKDVIESVFGREVFGPALANMATFISGIIDHVLNARQSFRDFGVALGETVANLLVEAQKLVDIVFGPGALQEKLNQIGGLLTGWINAVIPDIRAALLGWAAAFWQWVQPMLQALLDKLPVVLIGLLDWIAAQNDAIRRQLLKWLDVFIAWVEPLVRPLLEKLDSAVIPALLAWVSAQTTKLYDRLVGEWGPQLVQWIDDKMPDFVEALGRWMGLFVGWIGAEGVKLLVAGILTLFLPVEATSDSLAKIFVRALWDGIKQGIGIVWQDAAGQFRLGIRNIAFNLKNDWYNMGRDWLRGLISGLTSFASELNFALSNIVRNALNAAKAALGIRSPSIVAAKLLGEPLGEGIAAGILGSMGDIAGAFRAATAGAMSAAAPALAGGGASTTYAPQFNLTLHSPAPANVAQSFETLKALYGGAGA